MTGFEYTAAVLMMNWGMVHEGVGVRAQYRGRATTAKNAIPGTKPNAVTTMRAPWRPGRPSWRSAGSATTAQPVPVVAAPLVSHGEFQSFWSTGTGWGTFSLRSRAAGVALTLEVLAGTLACRSCEFPAPGTHASVLSGGRPVETRVDRHNERLLATFGDTLRLAAKDSLRIEVHA